MENLLNSGNGGGDQSANDVSGLLNKIDQSTGVAPNVTTSTGEEGKTPQEIIYGSVKQADFLEASKVALGREFKDIDSLKSVLAYENKYQELNHNYQSLKAKAELSPFADERVSTFNDLVKNGATKQEQDNWLRLQTLNLENMDDREALAQWHRMNNPMLGNEHVKNLIEGDYKSTLNEDGEVDPYKAAQLAQKVAEAKSAIQGKIVGAGTPQSVTQRKQAEVRQQQMLNDWGNVTQRYVQSDQSMKFPFKDPDSGVDTVFGFKIPVEAQREIVQTAASYLASEGTPLTESSYQTMQNAVFTATLIKFGPQMIQAAMRHAASKTHEAVNLEKSGLKPPGATKPGNPQPAGSENPFDSIRKLGFQGKLH